MINLSSLSEALKSLSLLNYGPHATNEDNLIKGEFKIDQNFDDKLDEKSFSHNFGNDKSVLIIFQSTVTDHANKIFWKLLRDKTFNLLELFDDLDGTVTNICQIYILEKLRNGENGILKSSEGKKVYGVQDIGNSNHHNLLIDAVTQNNPEIVSKLLKYNFDLDLEFKFGEDENLNAVDKVWHSFVHSSDMIQKKACSNIILSLLKANSKFPKDFYYDIASYEIKDFVADCEDLRNFVDSDDLDALTENIKSSPKMSFFYDEYNESLMMYALRHKKQKIYNLLSSLDLNIGCHEIPDLQDIYSSFEARQRRLLWNRNQALAKQFPKTHLLILKSKSKIANNDRESRKHWGCISEAYEIIDRIEGGSKVLQIVATCKSLKIFFDFKHDSTFYFNPYSTANSKGITYTSGLINIGAKYLLVEDKKYEVIGVIAHEFCHLSILMSYMNNFDPYQMGDYEDKIRFVDKVAAECERNQNFENMIGNVYKLYPKNYQHSELIVLVLQMMMNYYIKDPKVECENSKLIADRRKHYPELFNYFKEVVEPELEKALPILKKLQDDDPNIKFEELTKPMKAKILHSKVKFQSMDISLFEVIGNDEEILKLLPSEDLKDILLNRECFDFGDVCRMSAKYGYVERDFMKFKADMDNEIASKFEDIKNLVDISKIFILTGKAGSGKTTTFENLSKKLKISFKNYWISFIRLRNFREIFEKFSELNPDPSLEEVIPLLCKIILPQARQKSFNFDDDFEVRIFKKLFSSNQVILLFDGIDEICPKFNIFIAKILKLLKDESKIQLWISTRPQHVEQFEEKFNIESYMLEPYSRVKQRMMITEIFKKADTSDDRSFELLYTNISRIFKKYQDFNNPLIIVIMTELYISGKIDFEIGSINLYEIYEKLIDAQIEKVELKIDSKERSIFLNFKLLFQVLALRFIFEDKDIENLSIIRKWRKEKKNWTAEKIQRFGFVIVDLTFLETDDRNSIDFIHKTFAEFFVVQFIVEAVFNDDEDIKKEEIETIFLLVEFLESGKNDSFLLSFFNNKCNIKEKCLQSNIKELISRQIEKNINFKNSDTKILVFWCQFLQNDPTTLKTLWKGTGNRSLFKNLYFYRKSAEFYAISSLLNFLCDCLGENWYEALMDKDTDHGTEYLRWGKAEKRPYDKYFFKLLHFMEENFSQEEKKLFWRDFFCYFQALDGRDIPENVLSMLFDEIYKLYPNDEGILLHIIKRFFCKHFSTVHITSFMRCLEQALKNDQVKIQKVLFSKTISKAFMTNLSDENGSDFVLISSLYIKYKCSLEEVQNFFVRYTDFFEIFKIMRNSLPIFIAQLKIIFDSNKDKLMQFISNCKIPFNAAAFTELESFLADIFSGDDKFLIQGMRRILYRDDKFNDYLSKLGPGTIQHFQQIIAIYRKYQSSPEEFQNFFKSWPILSENFVNMTVEFKEFMDEIFISNKKELINCIHYSNWNQTIFFVEKNFVFLENFSRDFFNVNKEDTKEFIKKVIKYSVKDTKFHKNNYYEPFLLTFYSESGKSFERIHNILTKHLTKNELKEQFLAQNIYIKAFEYGEMKLPTEFLNFIHEIFGQNLEELLDSKFCPDDELNLILNEENFKRFEKFTTDLFGKDGDHMKMFVKKMFLDPENFQFIFTNIIKFYSISGFRHFLRILNNFKDNWEELQDIFIFCKDFLNIFDTIKDDFYPEFKEFVTVIFESNKPRLLESINYNEGYIMIENVEKLKLFDDFLSKFFENDENLKIECYRNILFAEYPAEHFPLLTFAKSKNTENFKLLRHFYRTYKISLEQLQAYFSSKPISSLIFKQMTEEFYLLFKELIVEIYGTNKTLLRKSYESIALAETVDDELYSSDIDYTEDIEEFYFDQEVMESYREDFDKFVFKSD